MLATTQCPYIQNLLCPILVQCFFSSLSAATPYISHVLLQNVHIANATMHPSSRHLTGYIHISMR